MAKVICNFKVDPEELESYKTDALDSGMTISQWFRRAAQRELLRSKRLQEKRAAQG